MCVIYIYIYIYVCVYIFLWKPANRSPIRKPPWVGSRNWIPELSPSPITSPRDRWIDGATGGNPIEDDLISDGISSCRGFYILGKARKRQRAHRDVYWGNWLIGWMRGRTKVRQKKTAVSSQKYGAPRVVSDFILTGWHINLHIQYKPAFYSKTAGW